PRPPDPLTHASGWAFPSGHAAHSTLYTWLAITLAVRVVPEIKRGSAVIAAGILLTALIGLTRVYLRVHWLSDVTSGWALGVSCFSAVAIVVLVIAYIRDNSRRHERAPKLDPGARAGAGH
ncbi:MAG: phosphatase PAP2 family protein, partial [Solirubrobacterales bacterium]